MMVRAFAISALLTVPGLAALAQPPPQETVTVTATRLREETGQFAKAFITPTKLTGKIARWESGICPFAVGQPPAFTAFVTARVKAIAAAVGAPVSTLKTCSPNIEIVFTTAPQELLDNIRRKDPDYLGYAESNALKDKLATVTRPAQGWYTTETVDLNGMRRIDSARPLGGGITMPNFTSLPCMSCGGMNRDPIYLPDATYARVTGNRINDGSRTAFNHIIIVVDSKKLAGQSFISLADYLAMLALTQLNSLDTCQQLSSIVNMMAPDCDQKTDEITENDLAYLHALYRMGSDKSALFQRDDIAEQMKETLEHPAAAATGVNQ